MARADAAITSGFAAAPSFSRSTSAGVRVHSRYSTLFVLPNELAVGRLGIAATKKLGGAVREKSR